MLPGVFPEASAIPLGEGMAKGLKGQDLGGMDGEHICHRVDTLLHMDMDAYIFLISRWGSIHGEPRDLTLRTRVEV